MTKQKQENLKEFQQFMESVKDKYGISYTEPINEAFNDYNQDYIPTKILEECNIYQIEHILEILVDYILNKNPQH